MPCCNNDVAACLGICNENGIVTCGFQNTLSDIQCDSNKTLKEFRCWKRGALTGVRTWLIILSVVLFVVFIISIMIWCKLCSVQKSVVCCEEILIMAPWVPKMPIMLQSQSVPPTIISVQPSSQQRPVNVTLPPQQASQQFINIPAPPPYTETINLRRE